MWKGKYAFIFVQASPEIIDIIILTCLWSMSFIAQSYFFSMLISQKNKDASTVPFLIMITFINFPFIIGSTNSQLREQELVTVLTFLFSLGPSTAIGMRCMYDIIPIFIRPSFYAPGCLDAIYYSLFISPILWLAAAIWLDYNRNKITKKNVYVNEVIDKDSGNVKTTKNMFREE
jgi:hypothetical protein